MECPECGYDVDADANFCPRCRHRFRVPEPEPDFITEEMPAEPPILPAYGSEDFSEPSAEERFTGKELQFLRILLLQPAMILGAAVAVIGYFSMPQVQALSVVVSNTSFFIGGAICVLAGIIVAGIFYWGMSARLKRFKGK
ncbi:MAG TPA: zinc ribbon domain-containing protein [Methanoregula sp.]|nr:zinc ribbon domain-containing protein [Methanoregula sp.]